MAVATNEQQVLDSIPTQLYIGGEWVDGSEGDTIAVEDPSTEETLMEVASGNKDDAFKALDAACAAQKEWAAMAPKERGEILRRAYEAMVARADDLALLMTLEMGKPVAESKSEITYAADFFWYYAGEANRISGHYGTSYNGSGRVLVMQQPVGPTILITPWNFPMAMGTRKIGPAIAAGCTMVWKPAKQTPLCALALTQILEEAGLPKGVLNLVLAKSSGETMEPLIKDGRARKLSFTGSTEVGRTLIAQASEQVLKVSMELGGNAPFLIFEDADLDAAVEGAMIAKMRNIGEACTSANRFHVAGSIAEQFAEKLGERMGALKIGRGTEDDVKVGPLIDESQQQKVKELVDDAVSKGASTVVGGSIPDGRGYFYEPTVLANISDDARMLKEEIFGPVAPVKDFSSEEEAVAAANDTEFGLVAYVFTRDIKRALRVCEGLETGMVGLNQGMVSNVGAPFGGVKQSGIGREGGHWGIEEFLETKYVAINL
ncbi:MAG: succinate-semialdehyde dehydrogenase / glutarate-semialdehyde dehydrogenase [Thermoleophilaceae bacterium]|jgi:succinate-semialdehyde dehydrogenase/glutarate-semialdehyde dehydrogenase|nr:succinate-semialdehyde dehydrogenase / glutarate-semialdehyde dehydrogenase [Thermoleophilaceae bacterium]